MPLPLIPLVLGGASLLAGGYGVKKGLEAKEDFEKAKSIGENALDRHKKAVSDLEKKRKNTNIYFIRLGKLKANIFSKNIKFLVDEIRKRKDSSSKIKGYQASIVELHLPNLKKIEHNT